MAGNLHDQTSDMLDYHYVGLKACRTSYLCMFQGEFSE